MVYYCCVNGCNNNSKKRDPNNIISYHTFPSNPAVKQKWLRAIGRPAWEPPSYTRICSAHFDQDLVNHESHRARLKEDAYPVYHLPPNSNFEASDMEVCRICLDTDSKQYSLQHGLLKDCMESITGFNDKYNIEGLPQYVCYECAGLLLKCYRLVQRSLTAQATLLDIFAQNGQITKSLVRKQDRDQLNLKSQMVFHTTTPTYLFEFKYDDEENYSCLTNSEFVTEPFDNKTEIKNSDCELLTDEFKDFVAIELESDVKNENDLKSEVKDEFSESDDDNDEDYVKDNSDSDDSTCDISLAKLCDRKYKNRGSQDCEVFVEENCIDKVNKKADKTEKKSKRKSIDGFTPDELSMQKHFNIVKLSLEEQIEDWKKSMEERPWKAITKGTVYKCETCQKIFAHVTTYQTHLKCHDPSRGKVECSVCKLRFKNETLMRTHAKRTHGKKFYCKTCPKVFNNINMAKKHQKRHSGHLYKCTRCTFSSVHESCLSAHVQRQHAHALACARCGRACVSQRSLRQHWAAAHRDLPEPEAVTSAKYRCEECELSFSTEGARRVHLLTSVQHRKKTDNGTTAPPDPSLKNTCKTCGLEFPSAQELLSHCRAQHPRHKYKKIWRQPGDSYPTTCEFCGVTVKSRWEHWWHVRREHPKQRDSYRRVYTAICETCGKGFQSPTKLRLHELRHKSPSVACETCGRLFYDKYAMLRHAATHTSERPYACPHCPQAFKVKGNLQRHSVVHTGATPFECTMCDKKFKHATSLTVHVRTVHYKLPPPPRKKRGPRRPRNREDINMEHGDMKKRGPRRPRNREDFNMEHGDM